MTFKMTGHALPGIKQASKTSGDGRAKSAPFQEKITVGSTKRSRKEQYEEDMLEKTRQINLNKANAIGQSTLGLKGDPRAADPTKMEILDEDGNPITT